MYIILKSSNKFKEGLPSLNLLLNLLSIKLFFTVSITFFFLGCSATFVQHDKSYKTEVKIPNTLNFNGDNKFPAPPKNVVVYNNDVVIGFDDGKIVKWDFNSSRLTKVFQTTDSFPIKSFFKSKNRLYVGSSSMKLSSYSLDSGEQLSEKNLSKGSIMSTIPIKDKIAVAFGNRDISIVNLNNYNIIDTKREHEYLVYSLYYDKKKNKLYSGSDDNSIIIWDLINSSYLKKISQIKQFDSSVRHIEKTPCDNLIITTGNGKIYMYDRLLKSALVTSSFHKSSIVSAKIFNNTLIVGDSSGVVSSWCIKKGSIILNKIFEMHSSVRSIVLIDDKIVIFSKKGKILTIDLTCREKKLILSDSEMNNKNL